MIVGALAGAHASDSLAALGDPPDGRADWRRPAPRAEAGTAADRPAARSPARPDPSPEIEPVPAQIVSAGHVVRLKVRARAGDDRAPPLTIDRLPANASFDANADGSRTLYWPTGEDERGEHRFRVTAVHPDDRTLSSSVEVLIVVAEPFPGVPRAGVPPVPASAAPGSTTSEAPESDPAMRADTDAAGSPPRTAPSARGTGARDDVDPGNDDTDRAGNAVHDPYGTYDDHPPYDPHADFGAAEDP